MDYKIILADGKMATVDKQDYLALSAIKWSLRSTGYAAGRLLGSREYVVMHRLVLERMGFKLDVNTTPDHINGDKLDNRRCNLRTATRSQNCSNGKLHRDNTSGYRGVSWCEQNKGWQARIVVRGKYYYLGTYSNKDDAALAYNEKSKELQGKFAYVNVIKPA